MAKLEAGQYSIELPKDLESVRSIWIKKGKLWRELMHHPFLELKLDAGTISFYCIRGREAYFNCYSTKRQYIKIVYTAIKQL